MTEKSRKTLDAVLLDLQKKHGKDSISIFGNNMVKVERVPLTSMNLMKLTGGGLPRGRLIEIFGPESSGKTTLCTYLATQCQNYYYEDKERNGVIAFIDVEHAFDPEYAKTFGLEVDSMIFSQPDSAEQALDIVIDLAQSEAVDLIIVDSIAALVPRAEADGEMGDQQIGLQARLMSKACRKLQAVLTEKSATVIFTNQIRMKIGVMFGSPEVTSGGNAMKFSASIRLSTRRKENVMDGEKMIGMISHVKAVKNKVATPFQECDMKILFGKGYQTEDEYIDAFLQYKLIDKSGSWITINYTDEKGLEQSEKMQGLERVTDWFKKNSFVFDTFKKQAEEIACKDTVVSQGEEDEEKVIEEQTKIDAKEIASMALGE